MGNIFCCDLCPLTCGTRGRVIWLSCHNDERRAGEEFVAEDVHLFFRLLNQSVGHVSERGESVSGSPFPCLRHAPHILCVHRFVEALMCPFPLGIGYRPPQVLGCLSSLGSSSGSLCQCVSHATGIVPPADAPWVWDLFGLKCLMAGLFNSMVDLLEVFMDHDPMSGCAPMVRGQVTYRGPQEVIGKCC
jgi:hypothetical protein